MSENLIGEKARRVLWLVMAVVVAWIAFAISYPDLRDGMHKPLNDRWSDRPQQSESLPRQHNRLKIPRNTTGVLYRYGSEQNEQIMVSVKKKRRPTEQRRRAGNIQERTP